MSEGSLCSKDLEDLILRLSRRSKRDYVKISQINVGECTFVI